MADRVSSRAQEVKGGAVAVCAAVRSSLTGTAPPSSSQRLISGRGSLCRSRCLRRSSEAPRTSAPIERNPIAQIITHAVRSIPLAAAGAEHQACLSGHGDIGDARGWAYSGPEKSTWMRMQWHTH